MPGPQHSKLASVKLDNVSGVLTDISTYCNACDVPDEMDEVKVTTFGPNTRHQFLSGYASGTVKIGGPWSRELDDIMAPLRAAYEAGTATTSSFEYGPEGVATGDKKHYGEVVMLSYSGPKAAVDNALEWEAEFRKNTWTVGAY